jgi:mono/diheme cytochrome c family protein
MKLLASMLFAASALAAQAGPPASLGSGVYSPAQAAQGRELYRAQCAECHGAALEGASGPPLVGDAFLSNWSARPLSTVAGKIQNTMPFNQPGSLSRPQSTALLAYMLQAGKFPAGQIELNDDVLAKVTMPVVRAATRTPEGNLAELMRAIAFPNSNIIFNVQVKDPGAPAKKELAASPFDYVAWGATVYPGWLAVDQAAIALTETASLLLTPGRKCQNGRPVPVDRPDWQQYVRALADVGRLAHRASQERKYDAFGDVAEKLNDACANCHKVYRDKGGTEGSGAGRCQ